MPHGPTVHSQTNPSATSQPLLGRREFMDWVGQGIGGAALAALLCPNMARAAGTLPEASEPWPHHPAKAKRAIHINLFGGLSQVDSFDYKPELEKYHGKKFGGIEAADVFFGQIQSLPGSQSYGDLDDLTVLDRGIKVLKRLMPSCWMRLQSDMSGPDRFSLARIVH